MSLRRSATAAITIIALLFFPAATGMSSAAAISGESQQPVTNSIASSMAYILHEVDYVEDQETGTDRQGCSGALIAPAVVLTSARCLEPGLGHGRFPNTRIAVTFGPKIYETVAEIPEAEKYVGVKTLRHWQYRGEGQVDNYDIALIWLDREPPDTIHFKVLYYSNLLVGVITAKTEISVVGFGSTSFGAQDFNLRMGRLIVDRVSSLYYPFVMKVLQKPSGICDRDTGGPGLLTFADASYLVGVMSATNKCVIGKDGYLVKTFEPSLTQWLRSSLEP